MNCRYCGSNNAAADHRCSRCGRRLHLATARPAPEVYPVSGARALSPQPSAEAVEYVEPVPQAPKRAPYQPALFNSRDLGRVVPIEAYQARAAERSERAKQAERANRQAPAPLPAGAALEQTNFSFPASAAPSVAQPARGPASLLRDPAASQARYSQAPVAIPMHRAMAAAIDLGMVMVAAGTLCLLIAFGSGSWTLPGKPLYWFAGVSGVLAVIYKLVWAAADADSPGLRWCQLKLLHFDGREPVRRERLERIASSLLSVMAGGLGLIWALVDEESLCWHDHSSRTFLTPFSRESRVS